MHEIDNTHPGHLSEPDQHVGSIQINEREQRQSTPTARRSVAPGMGHAPVTLGRVRNDGQSPM
jgi:hypothetical protein